MAAKIETRLMIGGAITPAVLKQLRPLLDEYFSEPQEQVDYALAKGLPITIEEDIHFGSTGGIEAFCEQKGLPFLKWSCGLPGQYDASVCHWEPGMDKPAEFGPAEAQFARLSLLEMEAQADDYGVRPQDLARFKRAAHDAVPPIKLEQVASPSVSAGSGVPEAQPLIEVIRNLVRAYDDGLNDDGQRGGARAPTGDDYNRLFAIIMSDAAPVARQQLAPAALGKGQEQEALKVLEAFVSECGGYPPDFLREVFGQAEDVVYAARRHTPVTLQPVAHAEDGAQVLDSLAQNARAMEVIVGALRLAAPVAEDAVADIELEQEPSDPVEAAVQRQNRNSAQSALDAVRQALKLAEPWLERYQRKNSLDQRLASAVEKGLEWVERSGVADTDPPEYLALREAHRRAMGHIAPPMEVYEATARLNGWRHAGHHWWNSQDYPSWDEAQAHGVLYRDARELCEAEDLDPEVGKGAVLSENCTFITDRHGDLRPRAMDGRAEVVESLRAHLNGESIRVAIKDGQVGLLIEEAFAFTAIPLQATVGAELTAVRSRFPEAEIWLTQGAHVVEDQDVAARAFVPADKVTAERIGELNDALYDLVAEGAGSTFTLSASPSM